MVSRYLFDAIVAEFIQARIADMADRCLAVFDYRNGQDASHAVPLCPLSGQPINLIIGCGDRFTYPLRRRPSLVLEARTEDGKRNVRRFSARRLTTDAIDDDEQAVRGIAIKAILIHI